MLAAFTCEPSFCVLHALDTESKGCRYIAGDFNAFQCIAWPNITLLDCVLYLSQYLYDPGVHPARQTSVSLKHKGYIVGGLSMIAN